eukprot:3704173-Karenia_brevis.AAC.1
MASETSSEDDVPVGMDVDDNIPTELVHQSPTMDNPRMFVHMSSHVNQYQCSIEFRKVRHMVTLSKTQTWDYSQNLLFTSLVSQHQKRIARALLSCYEKDGDNVLYSMHKPKGDVIL